MAVPLQLSQVKPDFSSLVLQLQLYLNSRASWKDMLPSSTGQTLIEMMASIGAFNQFAIENAARESFLTTAVRDSSIYAITRMLGVRIGRKTPASVSVSLTRSVSTYPQLIQAYTQFTINGQAFFNRDSIVFNAGSLTPIGATELYEGQIKVQTVAATSESFMEISLSEPGFVVSDSDVVVTVVNAGTGSRSAWKTIDQGIWTAGPKDQVYYDATLGDGDTVLSFGDGYHGALPGLGNSLEIKYVVTRGSLGNSGGTSLAATCNDYPEISGTTTTVISGGSDERPASYYKILAPAIYRARSRAVTPLDYKAIIAGFSGVASCTIQGQKDIAPNDLRWMNVIRVCILPQTEDAFNANKWNDFLAWFKSYYHRAIDIQVFNPIKILVDIEVDIALTSNAVAKDAVTTAEGRIRSLFVKDITTLGRRIAISDIVDSCALSTVDYSRVTRLAVVGSSGAADLVAPDNLSYFALNSLSVRATYSERTLFNETSRRIA